MATHRSVFTQRTRRRRGPSLLAAAAVLATAACGSTVQSSGGGLAGGAAGSGVAGDGLGGTGAGGVDGLGAAGSAAAGTTGTGVDAGAGTAFGGGSTGTAGSVGGSSGGSGSASGGGAEPGGTVGAPRSSATQGPGVTAKEIFIGVRITENLQEARAAFGAANVDSGDYKANVKAMFDEINARGGVAGRTLKPIYHTDDAQSAETGDSKDAAACETFNVDNKVAATISGGGEVFAACMKKAGVLQVNAGGIICCDNVFFQQNPGVVLLGAVSQDRMMADMVRALQRQAYFSGWDFTLGQPALTKAKIGILGWDFPEWVRPQERVMLPALARLGHPVDKDLVIRIQGTQGNQDAGRFAAEVSSAVLRFKGAGVTHLILLDGDGLITLTYTKNAQNQNYFPRLGINSATAVQALYSAGIYDAKPFTGATGVGWKPGLDLPFGQGDRYLGSPTKECLEIIRKRTGQTFNDTNSASVALAVCDTMFGLAEAYNRAGPVLNISTAVRGLESIKGSFRAASVPKVFLGPGRHDGLELGFDMFWDLACKCIKYRDKGHSMPPA